MLGGLTALRARTSLSSRRAMLDTLLRHLRMVRLSVGAIALLVLSGAGCTGLVEGGGDHGLTPEQKTAQEMWLTKAMPAFQRAGCPACHAGSQPDVGFLAGSSDL